MRVGQSVFIMSQAQRLATHDGLVLHVDQTALSVNAAPTVSQGCSWTVCIAGFDFCIVMSAQMCQGLLINPISS